jgi:hypothetical protein
VQMFLTVAASVFKPRKYDIRSTIFKVQAGYSRKTNIMSSIGNSLLCVTAVTVVCSSEICCAE